MLASAFGGLIAAGIVARMEGKMGRPAWVSCHNIGIIVTSDRSTNRGFFLI